MKRKVAQEYLSGRFSYVIATPLAQNCPSTNPNERWRDDFNLAPSIPGGCTDNVKLALEPNEG